MAHVVVTDSNFETEVLKSDKVTLVDFWASWCMPCQMLGPVLDEVGEELGDEVKICKVNVDENRELSSTYNIMSIPAVHIYSNGKLEEEIVGLHPKDEYVNMLKKYLKKE